MDEIVMILDKALVTAQSEHPHWILDYAVYDQIVNACTTFDNIIEQVEGGAPQIVIAKNGDCTLSIVCPMEFELSFKNDAPFFNAMKNMKSITIHHFTAPFEGKEDYPFLECRFTYPALLKETA